MFCEKCGNNNSDSSTFCSNCGAKFEQPSQPVAIQYTPPHEQQYAQAPEQQPPLQYYSPPPVQTPDQYSQQPIQQPDQYQYSQQPMQQQYTPYTMPAPAPQKSKTPIFVAIGIAATGIVAAIVIVVFGLLGQNNQVPVDIVGMEAGSVAPVSSDILTPAQVFESNIDAVFQILLYIDNHHVGWGSGFFIGSSGVAVTNHHVMNGMDRAEALLYDGSRFDITGYFSYDTDNDLAIIQVDGRGKEFHSITIGQIDSINVGDRVYAIGGPGGDPLTLTEGIISRFANEVINYDNYSIAGMLQTTAFIYEGNSGGPLLNDRGQVIGINSAGRRDRESAQWAVPADRILVPASGASINQLPVGTHLSSQFTGEIFYFDKFPYIPDFLSVSSNANLLLSGTAADVGFDLFLDIDRAGIFNFDYVYYYSLDGWFFVEDTDRYDDVLMERGFIFQSVESTSDDDSDVTYVFLYHPDRNISLVYSYYWEYEMMFILIGSGNAYDVLSSYDFDDHHDLYDIGITDELYYAVQYANFVQLEIYWLDGGVTTFFGSNQNGWQMESRNGGISEVEPTFSFWNDIVYIGFPTTSRIYNLFDDFSGFFGEEILSWGFEYN